MYFYVLANTEDDEQPLNFQSSATEAKCVQLYKGEWQLTRDLESTLMTENGQHQALLYYSVLRGREAARPLLNEKRALL